MPRLRQPETGLVVSCEGDLAARYQSRGWVALDGAAKPAPEVASDEPQNESVAEEKPVRSSQSRRR